MSMLVGALAFAVLGAQPGPPVNWPVLAKDYLQRHLKDPTSAQTEVIRGPRYGGIGNWANGEWIGWAVCINVNAKNSYGGYAGAKPFLFIFDERGLLKVLDPEEQRERYRANIDYECAIPADSEAAANPKTGI